MAFTLQIGEPIQHFELRGTDGEMHSSRQVDNKLLVVFFTCNHCPYVINSEPYTAELAREFSQASFVAINANDAVVHPSDSFEGMQQRMADNDFPWRYLHDAEQSVVLKYGALRTPHFFVFDAERKLRYTGAGLNNPRNPAEATADHLRVALTELAADKAVTTPITNPIGCNVKWKGRDAHWVPPDACDLVPFSVPQ